MLKGSIWKANQAEMTYLVCLGCYIVDALLVSVSTLN